MRWLGSAVILLCTCVVEAQTTLSVEIGWGNVYRQARWGPVFVTASDSRGREVEMELYAPQTGSVATIIQQTFTISSTPTTYAIYAALSTDLKDNVITLREARTHRWLASKALGSPRKDPRGEATEPVVIAPDTHLIAIAGRAATAKILQSQLAHPRLASGFVEQSRLPFHAVCYDSVDILMLSSPDLTKLSIEQQQAIVDWIRAGGKLVMWPGNEPAALGPLLEILPCGIGDVTTFDIPGRRQLVGRKLTAASEAETLTLFSNGGPNVYRRDFGLGAILLLPADISPLRLTEDEGKEFWKRMLSGMVSLTTKPDMDPHRFFNYTEDPRRMNAARETVSWVSDLPTLSRLDLPGMAIVLMGLMLIIGPIDSIVLKKLGQSPWTFVTSSGWIALVLLALSYGVYRAAFLATHFRSVQLIDEAYGSRVATNEVIGLFSRDGLGDVNFTPESWWSAAMIDAPTLREIRCRQDQQGSRAVRLDASTTELLEGQTIAAAAAMLDINLHRTPDKHLAGTLTNRSRFALRNIRIRTLDGTWPANAETIAPGATLQFLTTGDPVVHEMDSRFMPDRDPQSTSQPTIHGIVNLSFARVIQVDQIVHSRLDAVCVYAEFSRPPEDVELKRPAAHESHIGVVRAVARIAPATQPSR